MKHFRRILTALLAFLLLLAALPTPSVEAVPETAQDLRGSTTISGTGYSGFSFLLDGKTGTYKTSSGNTSISLENSQGMGALYLFFNLEYGSYTITDHATGQSITAGEHGFLHEYVDLAAKFGYAPTSLTISFENGAVKLSEIRVFSKGTPPEDVQVWEPSLDGGADLMLLATHGDDDQLFFAGLLPLYAGQLDVRVQVVYLTDHRNLTNARVHEMLNGLWAVGVEAYPVFGSFDDFRIDSLKGTYDEFARLGHSQEELQDFVVSNIRRFRPQVIVGHDINGEYGHGMHMVYTDLLIKALEITNDPTAFPGSAEAYGLWDVPKTYLHLYEEHQIILDYDQPLDYFGGLTAFQATQKLGYPCHESQQYTWFTRWINGNNGEITKATQITTYNPCHFGLYRSSVGADVAKNDFLEHITTYAAQEQANLDAANAVSAQIEALGQISLDSGEAIEAARNAFEALSDAQKALVHNLSVLNSAEETYAVLVQNKADEDAANQSAADAVISMISQLTVTLESNTAITSARIAYDNLTKAQKALVHNYDLLIVAEKQYLALVQQEQARLEQEQLRQELLLQQQEELQKLCVLLVGMLVLLFLALLLLRHKKKAQKKR